MTGSDETVPKGGGNTRRSFIQRVAGTLASASLPAGGQAGAAKLPASVQQSAIDPPEIAGYYPPMLQGVRGQNDEAKDAVHALRDGASMPAANDTEEVYDLVVVGSGMSGLASAYFFRKALPNCSVLVLEACDDFGGHARRNEFRVDGQQVIAAGGTYHIQLPETYTPEGKTLLADIGIDLKRCYDAIGQAYEKLTQYKLTNTVFFRSEAYGKDQLINPALDFSGASDAFRPSVSWQEFLARTPLSATAQSDILRIVNDHQDYMAGVTLEIKIRQLRHMSYADYLTRRLNVGPEAMAFIQYQAGASNGNVGVGPDSFSAWRAYSNHLPGFAGMGLPPVHASDIVRDDQIQPDVHLPDGNGAVARLLIRWLIPTALAGTTMEDSVAKHVDYSQLDRADNDVRIRLNSPVTRVVHDGSPDPDASKSVSVTYLKDRQAYCVKTKSCVLACFNSVIPHLCPEMPERQKKALHLAVRKPLLIATVALRNWRAFAKLKVQWITSPGCFYYATLLDPGIAIGEYGGLPDPNRPATVMMMHVPNFPGHSARQQFRIGREEMLPIKREEYEKGVREQLGRMLAAGGFDADKDIAGITINRWAHGYAAGTNDLFDPEWSHTETPCVRGRQRFGRITVANSDAAGVALTQAAFDQANRAVREILTDVIRPDFSKKDIMHG